MRAQSNLPPERIERSMARTRLFLAATIRFDRVVAAIRLRDLSTSGARIEGARLPGAGASVQIARGALKCSGTIVWSDKKRCGMRFDAPLDLEAWMPGLAARDQCAVDDLIEAVRSGDADVLPFPLPAPPPPVPVKNLLTARLAEELAYVARLLDSLGEDLCSEPLVVMRHSTKLQDLDISAQILGHVAAVLVADPPEPAIDSIGMTALRKRLRRTPL